MNKHIRFISILLALLYTLSFSITVYAGASPEDLNESQQSQAKELYQYLISNGYSKEAACGILGNSDQENSCDGAGLADGSTYSGAFQCSKSQASTIKSWAESNNLDPYNALVQFTWIEANLLEDNFNTYCSISFDEFKKLTSAEDAADAFCVAYEICVGGSDASKYNHKYLYQDLTTRKTYATEFLSEYAGITAVDSTGSNVEGDGTSGISISNGTYGIKDPATGLFTSLSESALQFPCKDDLSKEQLRGISDWKNNIDYENEDSIIKYLRIFVMLAGILFLVWIVLIYLSYWLDRINNFVDIDLLPMITGGRLRVAPEEFECTFDPKSFVKGQAQTVNHKVIIIICSIGLFFSVLVISGQFYTMLNYLVRKMLHLLGQV